MFGFITERIHEVVKINNDWFIVDTCYTFDAGWETAISKINYEKFVELWLEEDEELPTDEDVKEWAEELLDGFYWEVVQNYKTKQSAFKNHEKWCGRK